MRVYPGGDFVHNMSKEKLCLLYLISNFKVDHIVQLENSNREDFAKEAFQSLYYSKKKFDLKESMIKGYKEYVK